MFSNNSRISDRQLKMMLVFDMISISILIVPNLAVKGAGKDGLLSILAASAAAMLYGLVMLYFCKQIKCDYMQYCKRTLGRFLTFFFGLLYLAKFFFSAVFVLSLFTTVIGETILPNTNSKIILGSLILVSVFYASKKMEVRARMVEILYYLILIPLFFLFLLGLYKVNPANLLPLAATKAVPVMETGYTVLLTFSAIELILFATPSVAGEDEKSKFKRKVMQAIAVTAIFNLVVFVIVAGLLGSAGAGMKLWSTISVMQMIEIPGGFVHRQDALMLFFWLITIFTITSSLFHYLGSITESITGIKRRGYLLLFYGVVLFFLVLQPFQLDLLTTYYGKYMAWVGFPQSLLLPILLIVIGKIRKTNKAKSTLKSISVLLILIPSLLTGCGDLVEIQSRDFVLAMGISYADDKYQVTYGLPDLSQLTEQSGKDEKNLIRTYEGLSLSETQRSYNANSENRLDYRHLQVIILDASICRDKEAMEKLLAQIEDQYDISHNVLVYYYQSGIEELMGLKGINGSIGDHLEKLNKNNYVNGMEPTKIGELINSMSNERVLFLPALHAKDNSVAVEGGIFFRENHMVRQVSQEESEFYFISMGRSKEYLLRISEEQLFRLEDIGAGLSYEMTPEGPSVQLKIRGFAKNLPESNGIGLESKTALDSYIQEKIEKELIEFMKEEAIDYLNLYEKSSYHHRQIWLQYENRPKDFLKDIAVHVSVDIHFE